MTLSTAVIGAGHIGTVHIQSLEVMDGVEVTAVADLDEENRERAAELSSCRTYEDYEELLEKESLDVAVVALPPFLHAEAASAAAEHGVHVFVEKPLARSADEAEEILDVARDNDVQVGVDHTIRYQPEIQEIKEQYAAGELGHVPLSTITRINSGPFGEPPNPEEPPGWKLDPELTGGGVLMDLGVHLFDVLHYFFGEQRVNHAEVESQMETPFEDTASIVLESEESGTISTLQCGYYQWEYPPEVTSSFELHGIAQSVDSEDFVPGNFTAHAAKSVGQNVVSKLTGSDIDVFGPTYYYTAHYRALEDFVEAVADGREAPVPGELGKRCIELVEASYESADFDPTVVHDE